MTRRAVVAASLLALGSSFASEMAFAQQVFAPTPTRHAGRTLDEITEINRADCLRDETIDFAVTTDTAGMTYQLAVWVGGVDCTVATNRMGSPPACWRVYFAQAYATMMVSIGVREIVGKVTTDGRTDTPETVCTDDVPRTATPVTLHFLLVDNSDVAPTTLVSSSWPARYDFLGPPQPTSVTAGIGERALVVNWDEPEMAGTIDSYKLCWEPLGTPAADDGTTDGGTTDGGTTDGGTTDGGTVDAGVTDDAGTGEGGAGGGELACASANLVPGEPPSSTVHCMTVSGSSSETGEAKPLTNGVRYVVAVAAVDDFDNPGDLSALRCGTPEPVTGFFEAYRAAGGGAGGGYCAIGAVPSRAAAAGIVFAALGLLLRRRRRAARKNVRGAA
jgi:hypothetical protein